MTYIDETTLAPENGAEEKVQLTADDILNFEPQIDYKGYSPIEVDRFLDIVMNDYDVFAEQIRKLEEVNRRQAEEIVSLRSELAELKEAEEEKEPEPEITEEPEPEPNPFASGTNADMLRRLARLEAAVFGGRKL